MLIFFNFDNCTTVIKKRYLWLWVMQTEALDVRHHVCNLFSTLKKNATDTHTEERAREKQIQ